MTKAHNRSGVRTAIAVALCPLSPHGLTSHVVHIQNMSDVVEDHVGAKGDIKVVASVPVARALMGMRSKVEEDGDRRH